MGPTYGGALMAAHVRYGPQDDVFIVIDLFSLAKRVQNQEN
jgi:hypothetical protein